MGWDQNIYHSQAAGIYPAFWLAQVSLRIWTHTNDGNHLQLSSWSHALFPGSGSLTDTGDLSSSPHELSTPGTAAALSSPWQSQHSAVYNPPCSQSTQATACLSAACQHELPWAVSAELPKCSGISLPGGRQFPPEGCLTSWNYGGVLWWGLEGLGHTQVGSRDKIALPKPSLFSLSQ